MAGAGIGGGAKAGIAASAPSAAQHA